ncbi:Efflux pump DEP3 [Paramyrothecium foliicola]|nr:Efflux pump DEP3 [Paramyrothecium foliicola]
MSELFNKVGVHRSNEPHDSEKAAVPQLPDDSQGDTSSSQSPPPDPKPEDIVRTWFFAYSSLIASVLLFALDNTIVADLQPSIIEAFGDIENLAWIGVGFALGSVAILPLGKAYGVYDVKWMFLACVVIFEVGSVICGAAPNMNALIIGRVIAGVGGAGTYCGGLTYISVLTSMKERPIYLAGIAVVYGVGSVLGPVIGGAFADSSATWRWAFYINLVIAAVFAPAFFWCLPSVNPLDVSITQKLRTQDWVGITIFSAGSACFTMALTFGGVVYKFDSGAEITLWAMTGVLLVAFILVTIYHPFVSSENKLYPAHFAKRMELNNLQYQLFLASGCMMITVYYTPLLFQFTRGDSPMEAGVRILPLVCMIAFFSIVNGGMMPKLGYHMPWYVFGNVMVLIGSALMFTIDYHTSASRIYGYTAMIGIGVGSFLAAGFSVTQALISVEDLNNAIGFMSVGQALGGITLLGMAGSLFTNIGAQKIASVLPDLSEAEVQSITVGASSPLFKSLTGDVKEAVVEQITLAIRNAFAIQIAGAALGLIASLFLSRKRLWN